MSTVLDSTAGGLKIITDEMRDVQTVTIAIGTNIGARNENEQQNGISHFLEHMAFKGTAKRSYLDIAQAIEDIGGYMNAFTSKESTVYYVKVLKEHLETGIDLLSDIMQNSVFPEEEIEKERGVILQEYAASLDTPDDMIYNYYMQTAYQNKPLGRMILGTEDSIKRFTKAEFESYIATKYNASNMVLSVAGNVLASDVKNLAEKYFNKIRPASIVKPDDAGYVGGSLYKQNDAISQVQFMMGFKAMGYYEDSRFALDVMMDILLGGMSSRLFQEVREKLGLVYTIADFTQMFSDCGLMGIYAGTSPENLELLTSTIAKELKRATTDITTDELSKTITKIKAHRLMSLESTTSRSHSNLSNVLTYGRDVSFAETLEKYNKVSIDEMQTLLKQIISRKDITISTYGQVAQMPTLEKVLDMLS